MKIIKYILSLSFVLILSLPQLCFADEEQAIFLTIADPFIELHTGPSDAYPIFYVIDRGEKVSILKRKTSWFKIVAENGKEGWVSRQQMEKTLLPDGQQIIFTEIDDEAFTRRQWELGLTVGELANAPIMSLYGGYAFTENIAAEFTVGHSVGNVSSSDLYKINLLMQPFPDWAYSPFFTLGTGQLKVNPSATLIDPAIKSNQVSQLGLGVRTHLGRRFILRLEMNEYIVFSASNDKDENEDIIEWKIGFAVFF